MCEINTKSSTKSPGVDRDGVYRRHEKFGRHGEQSCRIPGDSRKIAALWKVLVVAHGPQVDTRSERKREPPKRN